jgi:hypothetical protein
MKIRYADLTPENDTRYNLIKRERSRLKKLVADLPLDNTILKEASRGNLPS